MKNATIWEKWQSVNPCDSRLLSGIKLSPSVQAGSSLEGMSNSEDRGFSGWWWQVQRMQCSCQCQYVSAWGKMQPDANCIRVEALKWEAFLWSVYFMELKEKTRCDMLGYMLLIARHNNSGSSVRSLFSLTSSPYEMILSIWREQPWGIYNLMKTCCCHGIGEFSFYIERISQSSFAFPDSLNSYISC